MANPWFRMYSEAVDDEKLRLLSFDDRWHYVAILCCKNFGILDDRPDLMHRRVAVKTGLDLRELGEVARRLSDVGLIDQETLQPTGWDKRQFKSDKDNTAAERQKRYRESRNSNALRNGVSNGDITRPDTDTDTDTDTEADTEADKKTYIGFDSFWSAYPKGDRKQGKNKCLEIWKRKGFESKTKEILEHLEYYKDVWQKDGNRFVPMTQTYLNKEGWDGWEKDDKPTFDWTEK